MKRYLETGNFAITEGAMLAGCQLFAGYPITPATEIAEAMSAELPKIGGYYVQAEDECAAMHLAVGAAAGGVRAESDLQPEPVRPRRESRPRRAG